MHKQSNGTVYSGLWLSPFLQECFCPLLGWALIVLTMSTASVHNERESEHHPREIGSAL